MQWCVGRSTIQIWRGGLLASEKISELSSLLKIGVIGFTPFRESM